MSLEKYTDSSKVMYFLILFVISKLVSAEAVNGDVSVIETFQVEQPSWDRIHTGITVDKVISHPVEPKPDDKLAQSVVSIGFVIKDNSFLPKDFQSRLKVNEYHHACTGTVIAQKKILTAAHCKEIWEGFSDVIRMSTKSDISRFVEFFVIPTIKPSSQSFLEKNAIRFEPKQFRMHPSYSGFGNRSNDLGVIQLDRPISAKIASIIPTGQIIPENTTIRIYGFSWMEEGDNLKFTESKIPQNYEMSFSDKEDQDALRNIFIRAQEGKAEKYFEVDTGGDGKNRKVLMYPVSRDRHSCPGTSGGPIFTQINGTYYLSGVTSGGDFLDENCNNKKRKIDPKDVGALDISSRDSLFSFENGPLLTNHHYWLSNLIKQE